MVAGTALSLVLPGDVARITLSGSLFDAIELPALPQGHWLAVAGTKPAFDARFDFLYIAANEGDGSAGHVAPAARVPGQCLSSTPPTAFRLSR